MAQPLLMDDSSVPQPDPQLSASTPRRPSSTYGTIKHSEASGHSGESQMFQATTPGNNKGDSMRSISSPATHLSGSGPQSAAQSPSPQRCSPQVAQLINLQQPLGAGSLHTTPHQYRSQPQQSPMSGSPSPSMMKRHSSAATPCAPSPASVPPSYSSESASPAYQPLSGSGNNSNCKPHSLSPAPATPSVASPGSSRPSSSHHQFSSGLPPPPPTWPPTPAHSSNAAPSLPHHKQLTPPPPTPQSVTPGRYPMSPHPSSGFHAPFGRSVSNTSPLQAASPSPSMQGISMQQQQQLMHRNVPVSLFNPSSASMPSPAYPPTPSSSSGLVMQQQQQQHTGTPTEQMNQPVSIILTCNHHFRNTSSFFSSL